MTRVFVVACGKWAEAPAERLKEAARTGAVFEALIAPAVKNCALGKVVEGWGRYGLREGHCGAVYNPPLRRVKGARLVVYNEFSREGNRGGGGFWREPIAKT